MSKNRFITNIIHFLLLVTCAIVSVFVIASTNSSYKNKVIILGNQFNFNGSNFDSTSTYYTDDKKDKEKEEGIKLEDLNIHPKTETEYRAELQEFIEGCKAGLEDSKKDQIIDYKQSKQEFIDKMEKKLKDIEAEMKVNDIKTKETLDINSDSEECSSKKLLERLLDRSDVDN